MKKIQPLQLASIILCTLLNMHNAHGEETIPRVKTRNWGPAFNAVSKTFGQASYDRTKLADVRTKYIDVFNQEQQKSNPDYVKLSKQISDETIKYNNNIFYQTIEKMKPTYGPPPTPFSVFTMGSLARKESGFFTDLEIGILVEKLGPAEQAYFDKFSQLISDRFYLLGEHPDVGGKGLRIDEADNAPAHLTWFARGASPRQIEELNEAGERTVEGSRIFLVTPQDLALHSRPTAAKKITPTDQAAINSLIKTEISRQIKNPKNKKLSRDQIVEKVKKWARTKLTAYSSAEKNISKSVEILSRNVKHLYGDQRVFNKYLELREPILNATYKDKDPAFNNRREEIAMTALRGNLKTLANKKNIHPITEGKLGSTIDIKKHIYRFPEQVLTALGFYYNLGEQNIHDIAQILADRKIMSPYFAQQVMDLVNYSTGLRLKHQATMGKQGYDIDVTSEAYNERKDKLAAELAQLNKELLNLQKAKKPATIALLAPKVESTQDRISEIGSELKDLEMSIPGTSSAIISQKDIELLNTKYFPILQQLYEAAKAFSAGDKKAFLINPRQESKPQASPKPVPVRNNIVDLINMRFKELFTYTKRTPKSI